LRNGRSIYRTWRGLPDGTEHRAVEAFLDVEPGGDAEPGAERDGVAVGVPHGDEGAGIVAELDQHAGGVEQRLTACHTDGLIGAGKPGPKLAVTAADRVDDDRDQRIAGRGGAPAALRCLRASVREDVFLPGRTTFPRPGAPKAGSLSFGAHRVSQRRRGAGD